VIVEWVSSGFYLGDIWLRFYDGLKDMNDLAKAVGEWLKDKDGTLWVQDIHTGIYIYARKPVLFGMAEQIEIRETAKERRANMRLEWKDNPPDWVVSGGRWAIRFNGNGYKQVGKNDRYLIWEKRGAQ